MIITAAKYVKHARLQFGNRYTSVIYKTGMCIIEVSNFAYILVKEVKKDLQSLNTRVYLEYLKHLDLRVSIEDALMYLEVCQNAYNEYFRKRSSNCDDLNRIIEQHESMIPQWIDFMLYGIAKER